MTHLINELLMKEIWVRENLIKIFCMKGNSVWTREHFLFDQFSLWILNSKRWKSWIDKFWQPARSPLGHHQASEYILQDMNEAKFYKSKKRSITKIYRPGLIIQITTWVSPLPFEKYEKRMLAKLFYQHGKMLANMFNFTSDCQDVFQIYRKIFHSRNC